MSQVVDVLSPAGKKAGKAELPASLFDAQTNVPLIHQVVVAQQAAARQGTHSTKTRGEVRGGGAKPWRQKGTGRARQGSRRAPQWTGGGVVHGPQPRDYSQRTPKKMVVAALRGALSDRARDGRVHVISEVVSGEVPSTKGALSTLASLGELAKTLVVLDRFEEVAWLSLRNLSEVHVIAVDQLNAYDVLVADDVVFTSAALAAFVANQGGNAASAVAEEAEEEEVPEVPVKRSGVEEPAEVAPVVLKDYGQDSYRGDEPPAGYDIKGNEDSMKYHTTDSPWYKRTIAEVWFNSEAAAEAAGFVNVLDGKESKK